MIIGTMKNDNKFNHNCDKQEGEEGEALRCMVYAANT